FLDPIVTMLGAKENTFEFTRQYVQVMLLGSVFTMGNYAVGQLMRSEGSTMQSMIGMIAGTLANVVLDPIFIFSLKMEIRGAAIATVLGNALGLAVMLVFYLRKKTLLQPSLKMLRFDKKIVGEVFWVGIPHTLEQLFTTAAFIVSNNLAASYGELTVAAMGVANKLMSFGSYTYQGITAGCQPLMGYNYGAKNYERMRSLIKSGILVTTVIELGIIALFGIFAPALIGLFTESPEVREIGAQALRAVMLYLPFVGVTALVRNAYNAMGKPLQSFGITVIRQLVLYIPFLLLFNHLWGFTGLIYAQPAEEFLCMILSLILFSRTMKKLEAEREGSVNV
ncbi:MAG: MATE family efflux transporter, partial [Eubacterium sp.]|nr:MATE family efflux transporter [Eubacterium sp.]